MNITLRNFKYYASMSEETNAFTADVYSGTTKIATAKNAGTGGCTSLYPIIANKLLFDEACKTCVETQAELFPGHPTTLEDLVDHIAQKHVDQEEIRLTLRKLNRLATGNLVIVNRSELEKFKAGKATALSYSYFKLFKPTKLYTPEERVLVKNKIFLKEGQSFYNAGWNDYAAQVVVNQTESKLA